MNPPYNAFAWDRRHDRDRSSSRARDNPGRSSREEYPGAQADFNRILLPRILQSARGGKQGRSRWMACAHPAADKRRCRPRRIWTSSGLSCDRNPECVTGEDSGSLAQLVEHLSYKQDVGGSSPSGPTSFKTQDLVRGTAWCGRLPVTQDIQRGSLPRRIAKHGRPSR